MLPHPWSVSDKPLPIRGFCQCYPTLGQCQTSHYPSEGSVSVTPPLVSVRQATTHRRVLSVLPHPWSVSDKPLPIGGFCQCYPTLGQCQTSHYPSEGSVCVTPPLVSVRQATTHRRVLSVLPHPWSVSDKPLPIGGFCQCHPTLGQCQTSHYPSTSPTWVFLTEAKLQLSQISETYKAFISSSNGPSMVLVISCLHVCYADFYQILTTHLNR